MKREERIGKKGRERMIDKEIIGCRSQAVMNRIEAEEVQRFTEALGIPFRNEVPPTFMITLKSGAIPDLKLPEQGLIHTGQKFTYYRPLQIGDVLMCSQKVTDIFERQGKLGLMTFVTREVEGINLATGELVFIAQSTFIIREEGEQ